MTDSHNDTSAGQKLSRYERFQDRIERGFTRWGEIAYRYAWLVILLVGLLVAGVSTRIDQIQLDTSTESYLDKEDPVREVYNQFRDDFGRDEKIAILVESNGNLVNEDFLGRLKKFHEALENLDQIDSVDSLINARLTLGNADELIVKELLEDWPKTDAEWQAIETLIRNNPIYRKHFVNDELNKTLVVVSPDTYSAAWLGKQADAPLDEFDFDTGFDDIDFDNLGTSNDTQTEQKPPETESDTKPIYLTGEEMSQIVLAMEDVMAEHEADDFRMGMTGSPVMVHLLHYILGKDMAVFSGIGILLISFLLMVIYRRIVMVVLPIIVAFVSLYFSIALLTFSGMVLNSSVQILPSLLLAVGVGNSVHVFNSFWQGIDAGMDKREALSYALGHSGMAVVMTGLTTAGGLLSFLSADIQTVADMGITAPIGILCTLFFSLVLLPALIAVFPIRHKPVREDSNPISQRFLNWCARVSTSYPRRMIAFWGAAMLASVVLISQISVSHFPLGWFPTDMPFRHATDIVDDAFRGTTYAEIVIDTKRENGLHDPELLHAVDQALLFAETLEVNGVTMGGGSSMLDISKELHQALNANNPDYYQIPDQQALIAQELLLFENSGSDDLEDIVDTRFSKMRATLRIPNADAVKFPAYLDAMESGFREIIGDRAEVTFTGIMTMLGRVVGLLISDTILAYVLAFLIIAPLMMLLVGSVRTGLIAMIPNLAPIILTLALMPILGVPLDAYTLLIGSIALGLAVDDTIHFMHNYQRFYVKLGNAPQAVAETLRTTGRALLFTSIVLSAAFLVNMAGTMSNVQAFGILTGFCIVMAFLSDVLLAPALVTVLAEAKERKMKAKEITA